MISWKRYPSMERIAGLRNEGRELLGKQVIATVKRDGENVSIWMDGLDEPTIGDTRPQGIPHISSHNLEDADEHIIARFQLTPEYTKVVDMLREELTKYGHHYIAYGELISPGYTPTRIEPKHKVGKWILFDILDTDTNTFLTYTLLYQLGYHWKIPVVDVVDSFIPTTLDELKAKRDELLKWSRRHRREGVVLKVYHGEQIYTKEKIDLPKLIKIPHDQPSIAYPSMPEDVILRGLQHAWDNAKSVTESEMSQVWTDDSWKNKSLVMPLIAKWLKNEAQEHNYSMPQGLFMIYQTTPIEKIKNREASMQAS